MKINIEKKEQFVNRHIGPDQHEIDKMLKKIGASSLDELIEQTIPNDIFLDNPLDLPEEKDEHQFIEDFQKLVRKNKLFKSFIGLGYYDCNVPAVIQRNVLENPGWYTAYTPYQAEIAQGRLEALVNFQTMVIDLTGMEIANASLLDEGTAAAEAMSMVEALKKGGKKKAKKFFVDENIFPQTLEVLKTRAFPVGIELEIGDIHQLDLSDENLYGIMVQYPNGNGAIENYQELFDQAHENNVLITAISDLLALTLLTPPGEMGADVVVGSSQRMGIPLGYGGPHAAFFATRDKFKRQVPGRIIGASVDDKGNHGYRMALQTREQHIRREKATSNICTAQVLLAVMAGMYGVYHGPDGLRNIAERVHGLTHLLNKGLNKLGYHQENEYFFDTLKINTGSKDIRDHIKQLAQQEEINFRYFKDDASIGISFDETCDKEDVDKILSIFANAADAYLVDISKYAGNLEFNWQDSFIRKSDYMTHPVFNTHHSEHEMLRYLKSLENKDLSLAHSMIPLGSCTMKLNATAEMMPVTWPELSNIHPFVPISQTAGYQEMFKELEKWLNEITGLAATSLQPNSGAQGEFTGLMTIRAYHKDHGEDHRDVTIIPTSAHGTNFASAVMAGTKVVLIQSNENGNIDIDDLRKKAEENKDRLAAFMVTYPTTYGVFNQQIKEICAIIHDNGGLVYMDGANMNAQVGLTSPAQIGADVCHLNLHKTFCIPHGGGGPGMGPICVTEKLVPYLPTNPIIRTGGEKPVSAISAAPWGSASILSISYAYIALMGEKGLKKATQVAILSTNYLQERLKGHYEILYAGKNGRNAHEMIIDCRNFKNAEIEVTDIAKRLMDYGFHAPTVSFPVPGAMMVEPTESETLGELDRFCEALISIRKEIAEIEEGKADKKDNVLKNAPHIAEVALSDNWQHGYSREKAVYPLPFVKSNKFWPTVGRIDSAYGDRNLMCSCIPVEEYEEPEKKESEKTADMA